MGIHVDGVRLNPYFCHALWEKGMLLSYFCEYLFMMGLWKA